MTFEPRLAIVATWLITLTSCASTSGSQPRPSPTAPAAIQPGQARTELTEGNKRFLAGGMHAHSWQEERVAQTGEFGQCPSVGVLSCADSRVPVETIFDQGVGDLFVVRLAGFIDTVEGTGTFEYGYLVLGMHSLLVLGHTKCGAVDATIKGKPLPGNIPVLAKAIAPAVADVAKNGKEDKSPALMNAAVEANVRFQMKTLLARSEILRKAQAEGKLTVLGGIYDVDTGAVRFLD